MVIASNATTTAFSVSLGRQWCCGDDTPKRWSRSSGQVQSILANLANYKELADANGGPVYLKVFLACFSLVFPLRPQPCFNYQQYLRHGSQQQAGCCCHFCCVASQPAIKRMADRAKEEIKMKLKIISNQFNGHISPAKTNGCCCCHCHCTVISMSPSL